MFNEPRRRFHRCYIAAPYGIDLGALPQLLGQRQIAWNWAYADLPGEIGYATGIERSDFVIAVLDGTRSDHRILYEMGVAEGLKKPVFVVATNKRVTPFLNSKFAAATISLHEASALGFQLDLFLSAPHETIFERDEQLATRAPIVTPKNVQGSSAALQGFALERRVYDEIVSAGGSAIAEPSNAEDSARPDLLMWLPMQEPNLLDPAVIEVRAAASIQVGRRIEKQLLSFMHAGGVRSAILLTQERVPPTFRPSTPQFFWLAVDDFVNLIRVGDLGSYLRDLRNRAAHGMP